jgi:hypothetical protein
MLKKDVKINGIYRATISNHSVLVRIVSESPYGGYNGINLSTGRSVRFRSARRLTQLTEKQMI